MVPGHERDLPKHLLLSGSSNIGHAVLLDTMLAAFYVSPQYNLPEQLLTVLATSKVCICAIHLYNHVTLRHSPNSLSSCASLVFLAYAYRDLFPLCTFTLSHGEAEASVRVLRSSTIRQNLDSFDSCEDAVLNDALRSACSICSQTFAKRSASHWIQKVEREWRWELLT